jgi:hypothetical protein
MFSALPSEVKKKESCFLKINDNYYQLKIKIYQACVSNAFALST